MAACPFRRLQGGERDVGDDAADDADHVLDFFGQELCLVVRLDGVGVDEVARGNLRPPVKQFRQDVRRFPDVRLEVQERVRDEVGDEQREDNRHVQERHHHRVDKDLRVEVGAHEDFRAVRDDGESDELVAVLARERDRVDVLAETVVVHGLPFVASVLEAGEIVLRLFRGDVLLFLGNVLHPADCRRVGEHVVLRPHDFCPLIVGKERHRVAVVRKEDVGGLARGDDVDALERGDRVAVRLLLLLKVDGNLLVASVRRIVDVRRLLRLRAPHAAHRLGEHNPVVAQDEAHKNHEDDRNRADDGDGELGLERILGAVLGDALHVLVLDEIRVPPAQEEDAEHGHERVRHEGEAEHDVDAHGKRAEPPPAVRENHQRGYGAEQVRAQAQVDDGVEHVLRLALDEEREEQEERGERQEVNQEVDIVQHGVLNRLRLRERQQVGVYQPGRAAASRKAEALHAHRQHEQRRHDEGGHNPAGIEEAELPVQRDPHFRQRGQFRYVLQSLFYYGEKTIHALCPNHIRIARHYTKNHFVVSTEGFLPRPAPLALIRVII